MQIGVDSFAAISDPATGLTLSTVERMHHLLEEIGLADRVGLDVFGIGISRVTFQMGASTLPHQKMLRAIEILGKGAAPIVRKELSVTATVR